MWCPSIWTRRLRTGPVTLRFRVSKPVGRCTLTAAQNGKALLRKQRPAAAPGEMERLTLDPALLGEGPLTVALEVEA